jgi:sugar phosphate isomerase/epimerase
MSGISRRNFFAVAAAVGGVAELPAQNIEAQPFLAGLVPGSRGPGAGRSATATAPTPVPAPTPASRLENFWRTCDDCSSMGAHHIEVNNTFGQIVQAYDSRINEFKDEMAKRSLRMLGFAMYSHWHDPSQLPDMIAEHVRVAKFLKGIDGRYIAGLIAPAAILGNGDEESYRRVDVKAVIANCNEIGKRVREETGIQLGYHPEQGDIRAGLWDHMVDGTNPKDFHFWPDVGHFVACGIDPMTVYKKYRSRMVGTHLRDFAPPTGVAGEPARGRMVPFGTGVIKLPELVKYLRETKFAGCVMGEGGGSRAMRDYMVDKLGLKV